MEATRWAEWRRLRHGNRRVAPPLSMEQRYPGWPEATASAEDVWSIRVRLEMSGVIRELALFNLAIDSKLRACDLVRLRVEDLWSGSSIRDRATIIQKKTKRPVQFEVTEQTKAASVDKAVRSNRPPLGCLHRPGSQRLRYHSMRRTKAAQIYKKTGNLRDVQILLGHTKLESTVRYLGVEVDDALRIAEQIEL